MRGPPFCCVAGTGFSLVITPAENLLYRGAPAGWERPHVVLQALIVHDVFDSGFMSTKPAVRSPKVVHSHLSEGEAVLLHLETAQYHELNPIGALIWELIDGKRTAAEIGAEIRAMVEDVPANVEEVVSDFLAELRQRQLIS